MKKPILTIEGTNDILFSECRMKKEVEKNILSTFSTYGYCELETPLMEYDNVFFETDELYRLIERSGKVVSLRPDITTQIARVTATKLYDRLPVRASYLGNVYRFQDPTKGGRQNEFTQAGIELLGEPGTFYDAEVIAATINALLAAGATDFMVELGNVNFVRGLLSDSLLSEELREEVNELMVKKDILSIEGLLEGIALGDSEKELILKLPTLFGNPKILSEMLSFKQLPSLCRQALEELSQIVSYLSYYGYEKYVSVDLGMNKNMDYYTGMIFKVFHQGIGFPIAGGGRYDKLIFRFGKDIPATGSAIYVNRLLEGMSRKNSQKEPRAECVITAGDDPQDAICKAQQLRKAGKSVILNR